MTAMLYETQPGTRIPVYPQPSIFETVKVQVLTDSGVTEVDHVVIEEILARPPWSFDEADLRLTGERIARLQEEVALAVTKAKTTQKTPAKKTAKKTPRKKP